MFWADHFTKGMDEIEGGDLVDMLIEFGETRAIFWIEVMNLLGTGRKSYEIIKGLKQWCLKVGKWL